MALTASGLNTAIWNNNIRSLILLATYPLIIALLAWAVAFTGSLAFIGTATADSDTALRAQQAGRMATTLVVAYLPLIATVVSLWFLLSYFFHAKMVRMLSHARPVTRREEPELYNLLENLCIARGLSVPRLEIIESPALNAYASGIDRRSYAVTVTRGLMQALSKDEMEAVLAHELTHIVNRDVRLMIVSVIFVGMIGFAAQLCWSTLRYHGLSRPRRNGRGGDARLLLFVVAVGAILWIGYMATLFTRFSLSRRREFMADAGAVEMTRNPEAMMGALLRISGRDRIPAVPDDIAMMCIENSKPFFGLFATHPPIAARVAAISTLTGAPVPSLADSGAGEPPESARPESAAPRRNPWRQNPWS